MATLLALNWETEEKREARRRNSFPFKVEVFSSRFYLLISGGGRMGGIGAIIIIGGCGIIG